MATGQVALTRHKLPTPLQRPSRQPVPAFLQKLHEMVNDPDNADLIRWSDAGDSFYVLDHERFAREVLGRWFKHQNFQSFVRQLNMYGFHKIPHLQQGVLKSESDSEHWNFAHANFHRGQPDLLRLIQRKKQANQAGDDVMDLHEGRDLSPGQSTTSSGSQAVDVHSIINGIATIKRHQSTISAELNELKQSNQLLWQDAMEAREKHQKQQDTINRIVKFLAGVFGNRSGSHKEDVESNTSRAVVPRRAPRFLIEDGRTNKVTIEEESEEPEPVSNRVDHSQYPIVETPVSIPSPSDSGRISPDSYHAPYPQPRDEAQPSVLAPSINPTQAHNSLTQHAHPHATSIPQHIPQTEGLIERSASPSRLPNNIEFDPRIQLIINSLTPQQIQALLSSLSHTMEPLQGMDISSSQLTQYSPPSDLFNQFINPITQSHKDPSVADGLPFDNRSDTVSFADPTLGNISKSWKATEDIENDVNAISNDIDSFIRGLGFDLQHLAPASANSSPSTSSLHLEPEDVVNAEVPQSQTPLTQPDNAHTAIPSNPVPPVSPATDLGFDFDSFLNSFAASTTNSDTDFSNVAQTFPDLNQDHMVTDPQQLATLPQPQSVPQQDVAMQGIGSVGLAAKRKPDVSELPDQLSVQNLASSEMNGSQQVKAKRRRNK